MAEQKRNFSAAEKAKIVREGMNGTTSIAEICRRYGITYGQFYDWQRRAMAGMTEALERNGAHKGKPDKHAVALSKAEEKLAKLHRVVTEITLENLELKKTLGA